MNNYYVYIYQDLSRPCKLDFNEYGICFLFEPFYVGKGNGYRFEVHLKKYRLKKDSHLSRRILKIQKNGFELHIEKLLENLTEIESFEIEKSLISKLGKRKEKKGPLVNITDGGEGVSGLKHSAKSRKIMSYKTSGEKHPGFGKKMSESTRNKISERLKANNPMKRKEVSESVRLKNIGRTPWNKGKKTDESVKKKLSEKKLKYFNIELTHKISGQKFKFNTVFDVVIFLERSYRSILNYLIKNESQYYTIEYDKIF